VTAPAGSSSACKRCLETINHLGGASEFGNAPYLKRVRAPYPADESWSRCRNDDRAETVGDVPRLSPSGGGAIVVLQQSTEPLTRLNAVVAARVGCYRRDQLIAQALMVAFVVIVLDEFGDGSPERPFTDENHSVQTGFLDRPYEPLRERVEVGRTRRQANHLYAAGGSERLANASVNSGSRSWIKKRLPVRKPSLTSVRLRLIWPIQAESGADVIPAM